MPDPEPSCPNCGEAHDAECRPSIATRMADYILEHPDQLDAAQLVVYVAEMEQRIAHLSTEVHQHWH